MHAVFRTILRVGMAMLPQKNSPPCHAVSGHTTQLSQGQDQTSACLASLLQHAQCENSMGIVPFTVISPFGACIASMALWTCRPRLPSWQRAAQVPRRAAAPRRGRWRTCASACTVRLLSPHFQFCHSICLLSCREHDLPEACRLVGALYHVANACCILQLMTCSICWGV